MNLLDRLESGQRKACITVANTAAEAGGRALLVGGCVRDHALGLASKDIDIEVYGLKAAVVERLLSENFRVQNVGRAFGVFLLRGLDIDVALPRRESTTGPGHRDFEVEGDPHMTPAEAAMRRDFTINAIAWDPLNGETIDPCGGLRDLRGRCLRHISDAFSEDPLRVLRGMQFVARFDLDPAPATVECCRQLDAAHLPRERLFEEWNKLILKGRTISRGLEFLKATGWVRFFPELEALIGCEQDPRWHPEGDVWVHTGHCMDAFARHRTGDEWEDLVVGYAVLCHDFGKPLTSYQEVDGRIRSPAHDVAGVGEARRFLERLTRHKALIEQVLPLVEHHMRPLDFYKQKAGDSAVRRLAGKVQRLDRLARVAHADKSGRPPLEIGAFDEGRWLLERAEALRVERNAPQPIIMGRHLVELGLQPGKGFKRIVDACYEAQLDGEFEDLEGGMRFLKDLVDTPVDNDN